MGEVYRARDKKLDRDVAVKILPPGLAGDPDSLARFEREAKAVAALSHPNILSIFDFGRDGDVAFAVMELLEGDTLRARLEGAVLPQRRSVEIAIQMAKGLAAAHEKGIVHRDLKPENVFLTADGRVKILDFGLAKRVGVERAETNAPTTPAGTEPGTVLGTVGYMSPEQVRGRDLDHRTDIFSFGAILYEMLSGRRAFKGDSHVETMNAILKEEPPELLESGRNISPALDRIVRHCLEKSPEARFHSAGDVAFDLEAVGTASSSDAARPAGKARGRLGRRSAALIAAAACLAAGALLDYVLRREPAPPLVAVRPLTHSGKDYDPAVSPDGKTIAFSSDRDGVLRIWLKQVLTGDEIALTAGPDFAPRFSPDGSQLVYVHGSRDRRLVTQPTSSEVLRIAVIGGTPRRVAAIAGDADWSPDGKSIAFIRILAGPPISAELFRVSPDGGEPKKIARWPDRSAAQPRYSPDGRTIAVASFPSLLNGGSRFELVGADGSSPHSLPVPPSLGVVSSAAWSASGREIIYGQAAFVRFGSSRLYREDIRSGKATPLVWMPFEVGAVDTLGSGRLVADSVSSRENLAEVDLEHPSSAIRWLTRGTSTDRQPVFSPDGEWIAFSSDRSGNLDIWEMSTKTGALRRLTEDEADDWDPGFNHDGKMIWSSGRTGHLEIWTADSDGSSPRQVSRDGTDAENPNATPDGWIIYASANSEKAGLWKVRPDGSGAARFGPCFNTPDLSPDGRYIGCPDILAPSIHVWRVADGAELPFVIEFPHPRFTEAFLGRLRWSPDGRRIFFLGQDEKGANGIYVQDFDPDRKDTSTTRRKIAGFDPNIEVESFGISRDGAKLVMACLEKLNGIMTIEGVPGIESARGRK
jgi:serine/threonine protein kinase